MVKVFKPIHSEEKVKEDIYDINYLIRKEFEKNIKLGLNVTSITVKDNRMFPEDLDNIVYFINCNGHETSDELYDSF